MYMTKYIGCAILFLCLFTSCPKQPKPVSVSVDNATSSLNIRFLFAENIFTGGSESVSGDLLGGILVAGDSRDFNVPFSEFEGANGIFLAVSGNRTFKGIVQGGIVAGMDLWITVIDNAQGGITVFITTFPPD